MVDNNVDEDVETLVVSNEIYIWIQNISNTVVYLGIVVEGGIKVNIDIMVQGKDKDLTMNAYVYYSDDEVVDNFNGMIESIFRGRWYRIRKWSYII